MFSLLANVWKSKIMQLTEHAPPKGKGRLTNCTKRLIKKQQKFKSQPPSASSCHFSSNCWCSLLFRWRRQCSRRGCFWSSRCLCIGSNATAWHEPAYRLTTQPAKCAVGAADRCYQLNHFHLSRYSEYLWWWRSQPNFGAWKLLLAWLKEHARDFQLIVFTQH